MPLQFRRNVLLLTITISITAVLLFIALTSWTGSSFTSVDGYNEWLSKPSNKLFLEKKINGVSISVKYLPPLFVVYKDHKVEISKSFNKSKTIDSLLQQQQNLLSFIVTIGPDKEANNERQASSIMSEGVADQREFVQRVWSTNFLMDEHFAVYLNTMLYKPALCLMENTYELSDARTFNVVFADKDFSRLKDNDALTFQYDDPYFNMGKVQFDFNMDAVLFANKKTISNTQ